MNDLWRPKMKKNFIFSLFVVLLFSFVISCDNDTTKNNDFVSKQAISAKWNITDSNSRYSSFEFTMDGFYIVIENSNQSSRSIQVSKNVFDNDEEPIPLFGLISANRQVTNLSTIHTGTYRIDGNQIILEGFGVLHPISITVEEFIFSFTLVISGQNYEYHSVKVNNQQINDSSRTNLFCRFWTIVKVNNQIYDHYIGISVICSKAGTFLTLHPDGTSSLGEWKWANSEETMFYYSWDNWDDNYQNNVVYTLELTSSKMITKEHPGSDNEAIFEYTPGK